MSRLADMDVLIVDAQTTGASPAFGVVMELGWGIARAGGAEMEAAEARWIRLPAGRQVPWQVAKLTGYDPTLATAEAIDDGEAWRRLRTATGFAAAMPTAIHYARFELAFLREWAARLEPGCPFPLDAVCVHAIARRLYPDLPRRSLRALAGYLGSGVDLTRRSLGHVQGTAFVWGRLCEALAARGILEWVELKDWLTRPAARVSPGETPPPRSRRHRYPIAAAHVRSLPDRPGVYRFLRKNGDLLYVGKAASLRKRVASHFGARPSRELSAEMLTQVSEIRADVAASALEAALLENEAIKAMRPPYNVALVAPDSRVWWSDAAFASATSAPDESHCIGPLPSELSLAALRAQIALLSGCPPIAAARAAAVGTSALWMPGEEVFAAGWAIFVARHQAALGASEGPARARLLGLAAELLASRPFERTAEPEGEEPETRAWDPERVARHLERAAAQAYLTYRRSRWLRLFFDSDVVYREPGGVPARRLRFRGGRLVAAADADDTFAEATDPSFQAAAPYDRATYDRLRILTTELRRIMRDGGRVWMRPRRSSS